MTPAAPPLFAIIARTAQGKARLAQGLAPLLPATFAPDGPDWHCQADAGFALHAPLSSQPHGARGPSLLSVHGDLCGQAPAAVLDLLQSEGTRAFEQLRGDFSLVFWDAPRRQLLIARDHMGQHGLFVREDRDFFLVCSALSPLLADPAFACRLDVESAVNYLQFGSAVAGRTLARQVTRVPAAHYLCWNGHGPLLRHRYYTPISYDACKVATPEQVSAITATLDQAITSRIVPQRQALLLSGGVDSSYIAMTAAEHAGGSHFDAYTIEFSAPYQHNEGDFARLVTDASGMRHHRVGLDTHQAHRALEAVLGAAEPCSAWASMTHHHMLQQIGGDGHRHLLSGLGSDEVFGGYWVYFQSYARQRRFELAWQAAQQVDATDGLMWTPGAARAHLFSGVPRFFSERALRAALPAPYARWSHAAHLVEFYRECRRHKPDAHLFELMVAHECQHRVPDLLFAGFEPIGRGHDIQTRYPFLDHGVATLACALGATERYWRDDGRWRNKRLLRDIAARRVPAAIMTRPLFSYTAPIVLWLQDPRFAATVAARVRDSGLWQSGLIRPEWLDHVEREVALHLTASTSKRFVYIEQLWVLLTLAAWHARWVERKT